jgi:hypothetical protein
MINCVCHDYDMPAGGLEDQPRDYHLVYPDNWPSLPGEMVHARHLSFIGGVLAIRSVDLSSVAYIVLMQNGHAFSIDLGEYDSRELAESAIESFAISLSSSIASLGGRYDSGPHSHIEDYFDVMQAQSTDPKLIADKRRKSKPNDLVDRGILERIHYLAVANTMLRAHVGHTTILSRDIHDARINRRAVLLAAFASGNYELDVNSLSKYILADLPKNAPASWSSLELATSALDIVLLMTLGQIFRIDALMHEGEHWSRLATLSDSLISVFSADKSPSVIQRLCRLLIDHARFDSRGRPSQFNNVQSLAIELPELDLMAIQWTYATPNSIDAQAIHAAYNLAASRRLESTIGEHVELSIAKARSTIMLAHHAHAIGDEDTCTYYLEAAERLLVGLKDTTIDGDEEKYHDSRKEMLRTEHSRDVTPITELLSVADVMVARGEWRRAARILKESGLKSSRLHLGDISPQLVRLVETIAERQDRDAEDQSSGDPHG